MSNRKTTKIDSAKLKSAIIGRGLTLAGVSRELGYSDAMVSWWIHDGSISETGKILLDKVIGIPFEEYKVVPESVNVPEPVNGSTSGADAKYTDTEAIMNCIAVTDAHVVRVMETLNDLIDMIERKGWK